MTANPNIVVERVTPKRAADYLKRNKANRKIRKQRVTLYAQQMRNGQWHFAGDPIRFNHEGDLLDGQHRLAAIVESGVTIECVVIRDLADDTFVVLDSGLGRSAGDALGIMGIAQGAKLTAVSRILIVLEAGLNVLDSRALALVTREDMVEYVTKHQDALTTAISRSVPVERAVGGIHTAWAVFAFLTAQVHDSLTVDFLQGVQSGIGLDAGDPRLATRNWMAKFRGSKTSPGTQKFINLATFIQQWNNWMRNRTITIVRPWQPGFEWPSPQAPGRERMRAFAAENKVKMGGEHAEGSATH